MSEKSGKPDWGQNGLIAVDRPAEMPRSSLIRGLLVLESFTPEKESYSLAELAKNLSFPKSSLYRVVKDLSSMNYLRYEERSKRYYLGTRVLSLGFSVLASMELREIARPYLEKLSRECNKTVNLALLDRDEMVYVERIRVPGIRSFNISIGARLSLFDTAVGKAVLANMESDKLHALMEKMKVTEPNICEEELQRSLEEVRRDGFAVNTQAFNRGILAIAVPVFSGEGVCCAINMVAEPEDASVETLGQQYAHKLIPIGKELSKALGYRG